MLRNKTEKNILKITCFWNELQISQKKANIGSITLFSEGKVNT